MISATCILGHSTFYPHVRMHRPNISHEHPPAIISWHIHICYPLSSDGIQKALTLRNKTISQFSAYLGKDCSGRFDDGRLCMINDHDFKTVLGDGPFVAGEWSMFLPKAYYSLVVPWLLQHRGEFSLLVHPNTGYEYEDHSIWAQWAGQPWPLNLAPDVIGLPGEHTNEHGHFPGDAQNPICVTEGAVCGSTETGPTTVCCPSLTCQKQDSKDDYYRCSSMSSSSSPLKKLMLQKSKP